MGTGTPQKCCVVAECGRAAHCRGYCRRHYTRWVRHGDPLAGAPCSPDKMQGVPINAMCSADGCDRPAARRSDIGPLCINHSVKYRKIGHLGKWVKPKRDVIERLTEKATPEPNTGCWLWTASGNNAGYGVILIDGKRGPGRPGKFVLAHRLMYERTVGPIPHGLDLDHLCRVRCCINPAHLEPVTRSVNLKRGINQWKLKTHCPHGHPYSGDNLYQMPNGRRACRTCRNERSRRARANKRLAVEAGAT